MVCDVLGVADFSEEKMDAALEKITVDGTAITFHFRSGGTMERQYIKPKKKGAKHTEEYKEYMRKLMKDRWKEGKMHGTKKSNNDTGYHQPVHGHTA